MWEERVIDLMLCARSVPVPPDCLPQCELCDRCTVIAAAHMSSIVVFDGEARNALCSPFEPNVCSEHTYSVLSGARLCGTVGGSVSGQHGQGTRMIALLL